MTWFEYLSFLISYVFISTYIISITFSSGQLLLPQQEFYVNLFQAPISVLLVFSWVKDAKIIFKTYSFEIAIIFAEKSWLILATFPIIIHVPVNLSSSLFVIINPFFAIFHNFRTKFLHIQWLTAKLWRKKLRKNLWSIRINTVNQLNIAW